MPVAWPAPSPPPALDHLGTPVVADGRVVVQIAMAEAGDVWDRARWDVARWDVISTAQIVDATCDVEGLSIERGRSDPLDAYPPAQLTASLIDPLRRWSPAAVGYSGLRRMRVGVPMRVVALVGPPESFEVVPLFAGEVTQIQELDDGREPPLVALKAVGPTGRLRDDHVDPGNYGDGLTVGPRLENLLARSSWPDYWPHTFGDGTEPLQLFERDPDKPAAATALDLLQLLANSDGGALFETAEGGLRYASRASLEVGKPAVTFTDWHSGDPLEVCVTSLTFALDAARVVNAIGVERRPAFEDEVVPVQWAEDAASAGWSGRREVVVDDLLFTNDGHGQHLADTFLERAARSDFTVAPIALEVLTTPNALEVAVPLELGDPIKVRRNDGHGTVVNVTGYADSFRHDINRTTWNLAVMPGAPFLRTAYARWGRARWDADSWA